MNIDGTIGDDTLLGTAADDTINGDLGIDTVVFTDDFSNYSVSYDDLTGKWTVAHLIGGGDGTDVLDSIEYLQFADQTVSLDISALPTVDQGIADQTIDEDSVLNFDLPSNAFSNTDALDALSYSATLANGDPLPSWLVFDGSTFSGTPLNGDVGDLSIIVSASDLLGQTVTSSFNLTIDNTNDAPIIDQGITAHSASEDTLFSFSIPSNAFVDVDLGDTLTYTATLVGGGALPAWMSFDGTTFSGLPLNEHVDTLDIEIVATDTSGITATTVFNLDILNTNDTPTVNANLVDQAATEDISFSFTIPADTFEDVDVGDSLTYSATLSNGDPLPQWLQLIGDTFSGLPLNDDGGMITVSVTATDGSGASVVEDFTLDVINVNDTPESSDALILMGANSNASGLISGSDEETARSGLVFELLSGASNGTLVFNSDGSYSFTPNFDFVGEDSFSYRVTDPEGLVSESVMSINVHANTLEDDPETQVNTHTNSNQYYSANAGLTNGGYVVAWTSFAAPGDTVNAGVVFQLYGSDGVAIGSETLANSFVMGYQDEVDVTALADGGFVLTWESANQDGSGDGIFGQRFDVSGSKVGSEFQANTFTSNAQSDPSITGLADGGFIITWESYIQTGDASSYGIFAQRYDDTGAKSGAEFQVNTHTYLQQIAVTTTELDNGNLIIAWQSKNYDGHSYGISAQMYDDAGNSIGSEFVVNSYTRNGQTAPSLSALDDGGFVTTWVSSGQDGSGTGIFGQRFNENGVKVGSEFQVNNYTSGSQLAPSVAGLVDGSFVVIWESDDQDGDNYGVFGREFDANGNAISSEFQVNDYVTDRQRYASVAALEGGGYVVSWTSYDDQDGSNSGVYKRVFSGSNGVVYEGTGGNDILSGSLSSEAISGFAGDDILSGGLGNDTLTGGDGADIYQFARGDGQDVIEDLSADGSTDTLNLTSVNHDQLWFEQSGDDLLISIIGESDQITVNDWYISNDHKIEGIDASDGQVLDVAGVEALVNAMATFATPGVGETDLSSSTYDDLQADLTANWQTS